MAKDEIQLHSHYNAFISSNKSVGFILSRTCAASIATLARELIIELVANSFAVNKKENKCK